MTYDETAFVEMAIASVLSQKIDDLELIIVNDNPDAFGAAFFEKLHLPPSVCIIHHTQNKGLSAARNTRIAAASGTWIGFLDADDYYVTDGLARQLELARTSGADITHAACYLSKAGSPEVDVLRRDRLLFHTKRTGAGLINFEDAQFITSSWASLYRRDFLEEFDLRFDEEQPKFEDRLFVLHAVTAALSIATLGQATRVWRQRSGSISVSPTDPYIHRLQVQLIEKCLTHIRNEVAANRLPARFEKRELFNTVSRLIWDMDIVDQIVESRDPIYAEFAQRIVTLLGEDSFGNGIFDDPVLTHLSRVGMRTRRGFITRTMFFDIHRALREGDFAAVQSMRAAAMDIRAPQRIVPPERVDADVIVHLGMHKTGSTYVQHHLLHHKDALFDAGIFFPDRPFLMAPNDGTREGAFSGHTPLIATLRDPKEKIWHRLRQEVINSGKQTVLLSCENMLYPTNKDRDVLLSRLLDHLGMFRSVKVVAYVRRPDSYVEALYKEVVANGQRAGSRSLQEFMVDHATNLTNLPALFGPIEDAIGQSVTLMDFDAAAKSKTIWQNFCVACDLPQTLDVVSVPTYPSAGRNGTQAARIINTMIADRNQRKRILRDLYQALPPEPNTYTILSPTERLGLIDSFETHSSAFAAERGYAPNFKKMRSTVPKRWTAPAGLDANTLLALQQSRLRAERPIRTSAASTQLAPVFTTVTEPAPSKGLVLKIKPGPWVAKLLTWRPFQT